MSAAADREGSPQRPPAREPGPVRSAIGRGFAASSASRGRTERTVGIVAGAALVVYLAAAAVYRWGADWEPGRLDEKRDRRPPGGDG
jgi:hypothetical protein